MAQISILEAFWWQYVFPSPVLELTAISYRRGSTIPCMIRPKVAQDRIEGVAMTESSQTFSGSGLRYRILSFHITSFAAV